MNDTLKWAMITIAATSTAEAALFIAAGNHFELPWCINVGIGFIILGVLAIGVLWIKGVLK